MSLFGSLFSMGAHEDDDELFDLFVLDEMEKEEKRKRELIHGEDEDENSSYKRN